MQKKRRGTIRDKTNSWGHCGHLGTLAGRIYAYMGTLIIHQEGDQRNQLPSTYDFIFAIFLSTWKDVYGFRINKVKSIALFSNFWQILKKHSYAAMVQNWLTANISWLHQNNMLTEITVCIPSEPPQHWPTTGLLVQSCTTGLAPPVYLFSSCRSW